MLGVILCCHESLAQGLKKTVEEIIKKPLSLMVVDYQEETESAEIYLRLNGAIQKIKDEKPEAIAELGLDLLVLCDYFGSRSSTLALSLTCESLEVLSGVNVPMLVAVQQLLDQQEQHKDLGLLEVVKIIKQKTQDHLFYSSLFLRAKKTKDTELYQAIPVDRSDDQPVNG